MVKAGHVCFLANLPVTLDFRREQRRHASNFCRLSAFAYLLIVLHMNFGRVWCETCEVILWDERPYRRRLCCCLPHRMRGVGQCANVMLP